MDKLNGYAFQQIRINNRLQLPHYDICDLKRKLNFFTFLIKKCIKLSFPVYNYLYIGVVLQDMPLVVAVIIATIADRH